MVTDPHGGGTTPAVDSVDAAPPWTATGEYGIRVRSLHARHLKMLNNLQVDLGDVGRREAVAALLEYYHDHPDEMLAAVGGERFR